MEIAKTTFIYPEIIQNYLERTNETTQKQNKCWRCDKIIDTCNKTLYNPYNFVFGDRCDDSEYYFTYWLSNKIGMNGIFDTRKCVLDTIHDMTSPMKRRIQTIFQYNCGRKNLDLPKASQLYKRFIDNHTQRKEQSVCMWALFPCGTLKKIYLTTKKKYKNDISERNEPIICFDDNMDVQIVEEQPDEDWDPHSIYKLLWYDDVSHIETNQINTQYDGTPPEVLHRMDNINDYQFLGYNVLMYSNVSTAPVNIHATRLLTISHSLDAPVISHRRTNNNEQVYKVENNIYYPCGPVILCRYDSMIKGIIDYPENDLRKDLREIEKINTKQPSYSNKLLEHYIHVEYPELKNNEALIVTDLFRDLCLARKTEIIRQNTNTITRCNEANTKYPTPQCNELAPISATISGALFLQISKNKSLFETIMYDGKPFLQYNIVSNKPSNSKVLVKENPTQTKSIDTNKNETPEPLDTKENDQLTNLATQQIQSDKDNHLSEEKSIVQDNLNNPDTSTAQNQNQEPSIENNNNILETENNENKDNTVAVEQIKSDKDKDTAGDEQKQSIKKKDSLKRKAITQEDIPNAKLSKLNNANESSEPQSDETNDTATKATNTSKVAKGKSKKTTKKKVTTKVKQNKTTNEK